MESRNFHHHHHQQGEDHELVVDSSCYGLSWSQDPILINTTNNSINSRDLKQQIDHNINLVPCLNTSSTSLMVQNIGFPWSTTSNNINYVENFMTHHEFQRLERIKNELSVPESYPKFSELMNSSPTSSIEDLHTSPTYSKIRYADNNQDLLLSNFSNGCQIKGGQLITQFPPSGELISYSNINDDNNSQNSSRGSFSQIFPTINVSSLNQSSSSNEGISSSNSFDMNFPALDLFDSPKFSESSFTHPSSLNSHGFGGLLKGICLPYGLDQVHQSNHRPAVCPSKISSAFNTSSTEGAKRPASNYMNSKATHHSKKSKLDSRPSSTPFKVRKEKLGDRIAALQQLVAPFGKTDTASVLMEAIGYINFLQNQVETLSVPYMKSAQNTTRTSTRGGSMENENEEVRRDLRSRGLCLVPVSCLSYVTDGGGGIWRNP